MCVVDLATFEQLLTDDGQALLERAARLYADGVDPIRAGEILRRDADPALAATALSQVTLRLAAAEKFGEAAARMYFTRDGLEQATRLRVSQHRATRIAMAAPGSVLDLGCGIGGDLIALSNAGLTV